MAVTFQHLNFDILVDVFELAHVASPWSAAQLAKLSLLCLATHGPANRILFERIRLTTPASAQ